MIVLQQARYEQQEKRFERLEAFLSQNGAANVPPLVAADKQSVANVETQLMNESDSMVVETPLQTDQDATMRNYQGKRSHDVISKGTRVTTTAPTSSADNPSISQDESVRSLDNVHTHNEQDTRDRSVNNPQTQSEVIQSPPKGLLPYRQEH
jgi:hypothetical protein